MIIDWDHFTPFSSLAGGAFIGLAAAFLLLLNGRIAGISGIVGGSLKMRKGDTGWRIAFMTGLVAAPLAWQLFMALPPIHIEGGYGLLAAAGLIVGLGTRYGSGCTSGHGVCGLARLSPRSIVATMLFMAAGFSVVYLFRHIFQA